MMARPKIGIFGALMALGGYLAVRYVQRSRAAQSTTGRELNRWEDEGGAVVTPSAASSSASSAQSRHGLAGIRRSGRAWAERLRSPGRLAVPAQQLGCFPAARRRRSAGHAARLRDC